LFAVRRLGTFAGVIEVQEFIADCRNALAESDRVGALREVLQPLGERPNDVIAALGEPQQGGVYALHHAPDLTVLNVVWTPGMTLAPHDHKMTAAIAVYAGKEDNSFFRRAGDRIEAAGGREVRLGDVLLLGDDAIHAVHGDDDRYTGAIHVYAGDFFNRDRAVWHFDGSPDPDPPAIDEAFEQAEAEHRRAT
jgi:predicted metal-dependent enzyme (double-stranded beta helix superfamily)